MQELCGSCCCHGPPLENRQELLFILLRRQAHYRLQQLYVPTQQFQWRNQVHLEIGKVLFRSTCQHLEAIRQCHGL
ncbi:hypothetical protein SKAU_G00384970 [Synaphobranchus kaupii]|uniref:Uncharacterized protein n=1 Tax=Synaphobranchus kaupii TaxID=118154 RepID=A0A9Q1IF09_SYNKA|nr:hypothetical protein SKAU_G00384970 [Synaphobranchus kaupii]